jgi:protein TonB
VLRQVSDPRDLLQPVILDPRFGPGVEPLEGDGGASLKAPIARPAPPAIPREAVQPVQVVPLPPTTPAVEAVEDAPGGYDGIGIDGIPGLPPGVPWGVPGGHGDGPPAGIPDGAGSSALPAAPVPVAPDMKPPRLVTRVRPVYPPLAIRARLEGTVVVQAVIGEDGAVEDVEVLRASSPLFTDAAVEAVRGWKYRPALQSGRPVRVYFTVRVEFRIE